MTTVQPSAFALTQEQVESLRTRHPFQPETAWVSDIARTRGWAAANVAYLGYERARGKSEMGDLMREAGVREVRSPAAAIELITLACQVFVPAVGFQGKIIQQSSNAVRIAQRPCPVHQANEARRWFGVTACPSWHRRHGWLDALGVVGTISTEAEMQWGFPACVSLVEISHVGAA